MAGILGKLNNHKGFEWWHLLIIMLITATATYYITGGLGLVEVATDSDGCTTGSIGICCYDKDVAGAWKQVDCATKSVVPLSTQAVFESPVGTTLFTGIQAVAFKYRITNTGNTALNANVGTVTCKTNPGAADAPACSGPASQKSGGGAFVQQTVATSSTYDWLSNIIDLQSALPTGTYDLTTGITARDTANLLSPVTNTASMQFRNTQETVAFTVQITT